MPVTRKRAQRNQESMIRFAAKSAFAIVYGCPIAGGFVYQEQQALLSRQRSVFPSSANTGYSCRGDVCEYVCSNSLCHGAEDAVSPQKWMQNSGMVMHVASKAATVESAPTEVNARMESADTSTTSGSVKPINASVNQSMAKVSSQIVLVCNVYAAGTKV